MSEVPVAPAPVLGGAGYAEYVVHTLSCRTCWVDKKQCPTAAELDPWRKVQR
ncbi:hypothetical protein ACWCQM_06795 [Streptomyces sp. NPDC002125]